MADTRHAWRVAEGQALARYEWDGEAVLFNDLSGATHLLTDSALWVLERLRTGPASSAALAAELGGDEPGDGQCDALLHDLHRMSLIEPC